MKSAARDRWPPERAVRYAVVRHVRTEGEAVDTTDPRVGDRRD
jgi:hypothetical protein